MKVYALYAVAACAEIVGCFCFWAWMRMEKPLWVLIPGMVSLALFAWALTFVPADAAGRAYAAYGGIYIVASLVWLRFADGVTPDRYDLAGGAICLFGASVILFGPRV